MDDKIIDLTKIDLPSNEPRYYKEYEKYANILKKKVDDQNITNIGIVAPYGAGKSSLIKTFIDLQTKENKEFNNKVISVSLANYGSIMKNVECSEELVFENEQDIEKSILQQLFYKNDNKNTPYSRFKTLKDNTWQNIKITLLLLSVIICAAFVGFQFFDNIFKIDLDTGWKWLILSLVLISMVVCSGFLIFNLFKNKYIKSIQVGEINFEKNENETISVFNQYLDEIIYFFQKNEFNILIIEDLDRFNNLEIFSKLKELNTLLNKNDKIIAKHKKITFIYAVKDSMFKSEEERSKFFEFILPVIPSLTSKNVKDELESVLIEKLGYMPLSPNLVIDISDYITSRRILNNVISDFIIHLSLLKLSNNETKRNKLFSLMVLKNIFPLEYERLQKQDEESIVFNLLNKEKNDFIEQHLLKLKQDIVNIGKEIEKIKRENLNSLEELKLIFHALICKKFPNYLNINYQLDTFIDIQVINCTYQSYSSYYGYTTKEFSINISELSEKYFNDKDYFSKKEKNLSEKLQNKISEFQLSINSIKNKIYQLNNMSFLELYNQYPDEFEKIDFKENFIKLILVNGYVDETHIDYLSEQTNSFMSSNDKELIKKINRKDHIKLFDKVDSSDKVILSLNDNRFGYINIFNYFLINELLSNKEEYLPKFRIFINMINSKQFDIKEKLEDIVNSNYNYEKIIITLCKEVSFIWDIIFESRAIPNEKKEELLFTIINNEDINIDVLKSLNSKGNVSKQINETKTFTQNLNSKYIQINELHIEIGFCLENVGNIYPNDISKYIIANNLYDFNYSNLLNILMCYYGKNENDVISRNYDIFCEIPEDPFTVRIRAEFDKYLSLVYNNLPQGNLSSKNLNDLLIRDDVNIEIKLIIAQKECNEICYSSELDDLIVEELLKKEQIVLNIGDILSIYKNINKDLIIKYIESKYEVIELSKEILDDNEEFKEYFFNNVDISLYKDCLGNGYVNIFKIKNKENINFILDNSLAEYCQTDFLNFLENDDYIDKYCLLFDENIFNELSNNKIVLNCIHLTKLYFIGKKHNLKLLDFVLSTITDNELNEIVEKEDALEFFNTVKNIYTLTDSCKISLIHNIDNQEIVEKLFMSLNIDNEEWIKLFRVKNNLLEKQGKIKYKYCSDEFYTILKSKVKCTRREENAYIDFQ